MLFTKRQDDYTHQKDQSEASLVEVRMLQEVVGDAVSLTMAIGLLKQ